MTDVELGTLLHRPPEDARATSRMGRFLDRVEQRHGVELPTYQDAWAWSVSNLEDFWAEVVDEFDIAFVDPPRTVLAERTMPGAAWFPGGTLNYAAHALRRRDETLAVIERSQTRDEVRLTYAELAAQVGAAIVGLRRQGVGRGDRVVAYLPNVHETLVVFLACAALGAIFSSCAPEFGTRAVVDRVRQIEPRVLLVVDGYRYGTKAIDRRREVAEIRAALPSLQTTVVVPYLDDSTPTAGIPDAMAWQDLLGEPGEPEFEAVPFDHPLYVLYSSGTTGLPKAIVHGHGGILLEHSKMLGLHHDLGPGQRFTWFTTTGWMMWNVLVSGLLVESTIVLFDGDPGHPDLLTLWRLAADTRMAVLGVSAPFLMNCRKARLSPRAQLDLSALRTVGSTGAPLPPEGFGWVYGHVGDESLVLSSSSGGTDVCTAFVTAAPLLEVRAGETPGRCLGASVEAYDPQGRPVIGQRGELVLTAPMPSMPVGFWNDPGRAREHEAYFDEFPGVWRHGDWIEITERGSCIITGRSDATLNRGGVRMGTSEFYSVVEGLDEVADSLVVHLDDGSSAGRLVLFVQSASGTAVDEQLTARLRSLIRAELSPRHVPDELHEVPAVPRTISGKKMEVPVKRLLEGEPLERVANPGAMADPGALDPYVALARQRAGA